MDVRSVDTSNLSIKRVEMDNVRPVGQKDQSPSDLRVKPQRREQGSRPGSHHGSETDEPEDGFDAEEGINTGAQSTDNSGEGHILDAMA